MSIIERSEYKSPFFASNGHVQTIYPTLVRRVNGVNYRRERVDTPDDDFIDIDFSEIKSDKIAVVAHGLEGNSHRAYVMGMVRCLNRYGWDVAAWNFRGCSGEINRKPKFYHGGATYDLDTVIKHLTENYNYREIHLVGFSMGGNINLKYLNDYKDELPDTLRGTVSFSVPCDLASSAKKISIIAGGLYMKRFVKMLKDKMKAKSKLMPDQIDTNGLDDIKTFEEFDNRYTAPLHGFRDVEDYWEKASCKNLLSNIEVPSLIVNAKNDPFLTESCFPIEQTRQNEYVHLEIPDNGGHVGFIRFADSGIYWSEKRAVEFLKDCGSRG